MVSSRMSLRGTENGDVGLGGGEGRRKKDFLTPRGPPEPFSIFLSSPGRDRDKLEKDPESPKENEVPWVEWELLFQY